MLGKNKIELEKAGNKNYRINSESVDKKFSPDNISGACLIHECLYLSHYNSYLVEKVISLQRRFNDELNKISFTKDPIDVVYNPTIYAAETYEKYLQLYCCTKKKIIFMGMNPGPFGMCQTGVPFGDVMSVRQWLKIEGKVTQPDKLCNGRQIEGFNCKRKELSGSRFWNFFKEFCKTPNIFFKNSIVFNYCPLAFMRMDGRNITPPEIKGPLKSLKIALEETCDKNLLELVRLIEPEIIIGIGRYTENRTKAALKQIGVGIKVLYMPHPSPRSTQSSNWKEIANRFMTNYCLEHYFQ